MELTKQVTNHEKENAGVWVKFDDETEFLIGSLNGKKYRKAYGKRIEDLRRVTRNQNAEQVEKIINEAYAEAVLLDWKNVVENGQPVSYSYEKSLYVLTNCPAVREFILITAANNDNFRAETLEAVKSNAGES